MEKKRFVLKKNSGRPPAKRWIAVGLALGIMSLSLYWPVGSHEFLDRDDLQYVHENRGIHRGLTWAGIKWAFTSISYASNWHPATWISHMLDVHIFGLSPRGPHLINSGLHAANTVLLFLVLGVSTSAFWRSAMVAALFAAHPLHVESVAWVAERKDVLSAFFWLSATGAYLWYTHRPGRGRYAAVLLLYSLGIMSKPMVVSLPLVFLMMDWWPLRRMAGQRSVATTGASRHFSTTPLPSGSLLIEKLPLAALSVMAGVLALLSQQYGGSIVTRESISLLLRLENASLSYFAYIMKTLWPSSLAVFYPWTDIPVWKFASAALGLSGVTWTAMRWAKSHPWLLMGWSWYLVTLLPVIGLVQVGHQALADRYTYLPLIGFFMIVIWGAHGLFRGRPSGRIVLSVAGGLVILACITISHAQIKYWRDSITLFTHALLVTRDNGDARYNLGSSFLSRRRLQEAVIHLQRAVELAPTYADAWNNLGTTLQRLGRRTEAIESLEKAIDLNPTNKRPYMNLGLLYLSIGDQGRAWQVYQSLQRLDPQEAERLAQFIQMARKGRER